MKPLLSFSIVCVIATSGCSTGSQVPVSSLVESERAFAALSLARDTRTAFLTFLDDSSVIFRPHPVNGKEWIGKQPTRTSVLSWEPVFADCSESGDMGFTTGPWKFSRSSSEDEPVAFGYFVSVWGRREGGGWRVLLDIGTSNPKPGREVERLHFGPLSRGGGKADRARAHDSFVNAELHLGQDLQRSGIAAAYRSAAAEECRFYREGHAPSIGFESARSILGETPAVPQYTLIALHESASGDLAYAYGRIDFPPATGPAGYYLRIWSRTPSGSPTLVLDLLSPMPNE